MYCLLLKLDMQIRVVVVGKTSAKYLVEGIAEYEKRLKRYCSFSWIVIPDLSIRGKTSVNELKEKEGNAILSKVSPNEFMVLFDEAGEQFTSVGFSRWIEKRALAGNSKLTFVVGGAYGFSEEVYKKSNARISFSKMTFSHQMIRLLIIEQVYRAFSIKHNLPYHH